MTLTSELDLDRVKVNHHAKYVGQRSFRSKVIVRTARQTHTTDRLLYTATKVIVKDTVDTINN